MRSVIIRLSCTILLLGTGLGCNLEKVQQLRGSINELERFRGSVDKRVETLEASLSQLRSTMEGLSSALGEVKSAWERRQEQLQQVQSRLDSLEPSLKRIPEVSAQLDRLDSKYSTNLEKHRQLLEKQNKESMEELTRFKTDIQEATSHLHIFLQTLSEALSKQEMAVASSLEIINKGFGEKSEYGRRVRADRLFEKAFRTHMSALRTDSPEELAEALQLYKEGLILNPERTSMRLNAAKVLLSLKRNDEAMKELALVATRENEDEYAKEAEALLKTLRTG